MASAFPKPGIVLEGTLQWKTGGKWKTMYVVQRRRYMEFYDSKQDSNLGYDALQGTLLVDKGAICTETKNSRKNYQLKLTTKAIISNEDVDRVNHFKCENETDREKWWTVLSYLATGATPQRRESKLVPNFKIDLIDYMKNLDDYERSRDEAEKAGTPLSHAPSFNRRELPPTPGRRKESATPSFGSDTESSGAGSNQSSDSGVISVHRFYHEHQRNFDTPKWFFGAISREQAEEILRNSAHGNVLMRQSSKKYGLYVISMRTSDGRNFHYEVYPEENGYKIKCQTQHEIAYCLDEVMQTYLSLTPGGPRLVSCNRLSEYGVNAHNYTDGDNLLDCQTRFDRDSDSGERTRTLTEENQEEYEATCNIPLDPRLRHNYDYHVPGSDNNQPEYVCMDQKLLKKS